MTKISEYTKKCSLCLKESNHRELISTIQMGYKDLDMRPPELARSTIDLWIQICPFCGYCAPDIDISENSEGAIQIVQSDQYKEQLKNTEYPELANSFLCYSIIQENSGNFFIAGNSCIHAAWICDDKGFFEGAKRCRLKAVSLLKYSKENGQVCNKDKLGKEVIIVDLLRRAGEFEEALKICENGLDRNPDLIIKNILLFQQMLIVRHSIKCYTIEKPILNAKQCKINDILKQCKNVVCIDLPFLSDLPVELIISVLNVYYKYYFIDSYLENDPVTLKLINEMRIFLNIQDYKNEYEMLRLKIERMLDLLKTLNSINKDKQLKYYNSWLNICLDSLKYDINNAQNKSRLRRVIERHFKKKLVKENVDIYGRFLKL